jgi:predicted alpha/beta hydrolase
VSSSHGYWARWPGLGHRLRTWWWWKVTAPRLLRRRRSLPASVFGAELPMHVGLELARYCLHPDFFCDTAGVPLRPHNAEIRGPLRHMIFSDDEVFPPCAAIDLAHHFPNARHETRTYRPEEFGVGAIGHFGLFRRNAPAALWWEVEEWLP